MRQGFRPLRGLQVSSSPLIQLKHTHVSWWTAKIIGKERFNVSLSFTAKRPSLKTLDRSFTNYIIIWPRKKHYVWDWNLPANRVKVWDLLLRSYRSSYPHRVRDVFPFSVIFGETPTLCYTYLLSLKAHPIKFGQFYKNSIFGKFNGPPSPNQSGFATPLEIGARILNLQIIWFTFRSLLT